MFTVENSCHKYSQLNLQRWHKCTAIQAQKYNVKRNLWGKGKRMESYSVQTKQRNQVWEKKIYDSMVSYGWVSSRNYLAALYTAASGFTGSGSFSKGSPCHAISLLSFPWITAHYNTTIGLVQIHAMQQCSGFFNSEFGRIVVQALHNKYWIKHWILNIFKGNFTMNNRGLMILFYIHRVLAQYDFFKYFY